jgi:hypothetical protein
MYFCKRVIIFCIIVIIQKNKKLPKRLRIANIIPAVSIKQMPAVPSILRYKKVVNWGLTAQAINFAQSSFMGHRVCFSVPVDFMNQYLTWSRASGELRPTGRFNNNPNAAGYVPTFEEMLTRCLGSEYTDLDGVATGLNYSSEALEAITDMKRDQNLSNNDWDYSPLGATPATASTPIAVGTHYGANDLVMAFVLNKCFGSSAFDAYGVVYNLDDGFGMLTNEQLAAVIKASLAEEEALAAAQVSPAKAVAAQQPGDIKGQVDAMFRSLLSIDPQRFYKGGKQITGLFESNTDADASGNWCLAVGDKIEIPVRLFFRAPVTVLSVVDGAKNGSSDTPDQVETVFIKGDLTGAQRDPGTYTPAQAAAALAEDRGNMMAIRLQILCSAPAINPAKTLSTSEGPAANVAAQVANVANPIFYKGANYPSQSAMVVVYAGTDNSWTLTTDALPNGLSAALSGNAAVFTYNPVGSTAAPGQTTVAVTLTPASGAALVKNVIVTISAPPPAV